MTDSFDQLDPDAAHPSVGGSWTVGDDREDTMTHTLDEDADGVPDFTPTAPARWSRPFWADLAERTLSTWLQSAVALVPTTALLLSDVDWSVVASASTLAAVMAAAKALIRALPTDTL